MRISDWSSDVCSSDLIGEQIEESRDLPPLTRIFGCQFRNDRWELPALTPETRSTSGSLHLGPIHVILEAAAIDAAEKAGGVALQAEEWEVMFTARAWWGRSSRRRTAYTGRAHGSPPASHCGTRSEEHTSERQPLM